MQIVAPATSAERRGFLIMSGDQAVDADAGISLSTAWMRDRPEDAGTRAYGASEDDPPAAPRGNPVAIAFRGLAMASGSRNFWLLAATFFICGASTNGVIGTRRKRLPTPSTFNRLWPVASIA